MEKRILAVGRIFPNGRTSRRKETEFVMDFEHEVTGFYINLLPLSERK
jgi:hypothetical protein